MIDEPKANKCLIRTKCGHCDGSPCQHFTEREYNQCKYKQGSSCTSKMARVNAMTVALIKEGVMVDTAPVIKKLSKVSRILDDAGFTAQKARKQSGISLASLMVKEAIEMLKKED